MDLTARLVDFVHTTQKPASDERPLQGPCCETHATLLDTRLGEFTAAYPDPVRGPILKWFRKKIKPPSAPSWLSHKCHDSDYNHLQSENQSNSTAHSASASLPSRCEYGVTDKGLSCRTRSILFDPKTNIPRGKSIQAGATQYWIHTKPIDKNTGWQSEGYWTDASGNVLPKVAKDIEGIGEMCLDGYIKAFGRKTGGGRVCSQSTIDEAVEELKNTYHGDVRPFKNLRVLATIEATWFS